MSRVLDQQVLSLTSPRALQTLRKADRAGIADDTSGSGASIGPAACKTCFLIPPGQACCLERGSSSCEAGQWIILITPPKSPDTIPRWRGMASSQFPKPSSPDTCIRGHLSYQGVLGVQQQELGGRGGGAHCRHFLALAVKSEL